MPRNGEAVFQISNVSIQFGSQTVLENANLTILPNERIGLTGPNGSGKSTLLKILSGESIPYDGQRIIPPNSTVGYLPQEMAIFEKSHSLFAEVMTVFESLIAMENEMRRLEHEISLHHRKEDLKRYGDLQDEFQRREGFTMEARAREVLTGLGFSMKDMERPVREFSGGWRMRIALAKLLLTHPDLLLLDEPTNHLDMETVIWLESFLMKYSGAIVLVSHDRYFMDRIITGIADISFNEIRQYPGNFSDFEVTRMKELETLKAAQKNQQRKLAQMERFIERFRYKATKARQVQSRIKQLGKIERITIEKDDSAIRFSFPEPKRSGDPLLTLKNLTFGYTDKPVLKEANLELRRGERAAVIGVNGAGKSTLLKLISGELTPQKGDLRLGYNAEMAYFAQHQLEQLNPKATILDEVWHENPAIQQHRIRGILGRFLFSDEDVFKPIQVLSGGEKSRVVLVKMLLKGANFLILDEPTNHLDLQSKEILANALDDFAGSVIIVSHDRFFLDLLVKKIFIVENQQVRTFLGNYSDYEAWTENKKPDSANDDSGEKRDADKERRRREAQLRAELARKKKPLTEKLAHIDKALHQAQKYRDELLALLNGPNFSRYTAEKMAEISQNYQKNSDELERLESEWLELTEAIEALENEQ
jgi:ATP-binding cassette, subfamily F, member 3